MAADINLIVIMDYVIVGMQAVLHKLLAIIVIAFDLKVV